MRPLDTFLQEVKYAFRSLVHTPSFSLIAILVLALGIGSNLAVFALIDSIFLRPLPVSRPSELLQLSSVDRAGQIGPIFSKVLDPLRSEPVFRGVCGFTARRIASDLAGAIQGTDLLAMDGDCLSTLGLKAQAGRVFGRADDSAVGERVALLTDRAWRNLFAASAEILGKRVKIGPADFRIVGVIEKQFTGLSAEFSPAVIIPLAQLDFAPVANRPLYFFVDILARRAPGVSDENVRASMAVRERALFEQSVPTRYNPAQRQEYFARKLVVENAGSAEERWLGRRFARPLFAILGVCLLALLVACVNLTVLLLGRGMTRHTDIAVRMALGASRQSVVRLLALESLLLVFAGAALGVTLGLWATWEAARQITSLLSIYVTPEIDGRLVVFVAVLVAIAALLTLGPAWQAASGRYAGRLRESGRGIVRSGARGQKVLLGMQVAMTLALVAASSLFASSLRNLYSLRYGIKGQGVSMTLLATVPGAGGAPVRPYYQDLLREIGELSDVAFVSMANYAPYWTAASTEPLSSPDSNESAADVQVQPLSITNGFLSTLGIPIVAGEGFQPPGQEPAERVAVVSESLAKLFGGEKIIGRHVRVGQDESSAPLRVIGIAADIRLSLEHPEQLSSHVVYTNLWQDPDNRSPVLLIKTTSGIPLSAGVLRRILADRGRQYVENYRTIDQAKDDALVENRLLAQLSVAFGVLALTLAALGLFGLLNYYVSGRTSEIGIRMALGAERESIFWLVARQILVIVGLGAVAGIALFLMLGKLLMGLVYGISAYNAWPIAISVTLIASTALLATWIPARRAATVDPLIALRHE